MQTYGSKSQVYNGSAEQTKGGLKKKDIIKIKDAYGNVRYKSKVQQKTKKNDFRAKWSRAMKRARNQLIKEKKIIPGEFVPVGGKTKKGKLLYKRTKDLF